MKALFITPSYKPAYVYGGPTFSVSNTAENLSNYIEVQVITTTANGENELLINTNEIQIVDKVRVIYFNRQTKDHSHLSFGLLSYLWNHGSEYEIIHIQSWWNLTSIFSAAICYLRNWKYIVTPRGMLSPYTFNNSKLKKLFHSIFGDEVLKHSTIQSTSNNEYNKLKMLNDNYQVCVIPNHIDFNLPQIDKGSNEIAQLLFLSRVHPKKGIENLINALPFLENGFHLNIVGDGDHVYINDLKSLVNKLNLNDKITWHGSLYENDKYQIYAKSDFMILPSQDENFANNVIESLMFGTPVVLSKEVGLADFVVEKDLGWVYDGSHDNLVEVMNNAMNDKIRILEINKKARRILLEEFDANKINNQYIEMYNSVINAH